ncbi:hypothetical protein BJ546DRAFT_317832 [Cryomyces antarcticus]
MLLCRVFVFADMRGVKELEKAVVDALVTSLTVERNTAFFNSLSYIYGNTPPSSALRKLYVDWATNDYDMSGVLAGSSANREILPVGFVCDLANAIQALHPAKKARNRADWVRNKHPYHEEEWFPNTMYVRS